MKIKHLLYLAAVLIIVNLPFANARTISVYAPSTENSITILVENSKAPFIKRVVTVTATSSDLIQLSGNVSKKALIQSGESHSFSFTFDVACIDTNKKGYLYFSASVDIGSVIIDTPVVDVQIKTNLNKCEICSSNNEIVQRICPAPDLCHTLIDPCDPFIGCIYMPLKTRNCNTHIPGESDIHFTNTSEPGDQFITSYYLSKNSSSGSKDNLAISYEIVAPSLVTIMIYDALGNKIKTLINHQSKSEGNYQAIWNGRNDSDDTVSEGQYYGMIQVIDKNTLLTDTLSIDEIIVDNTIPEANIDHLSQTNFQGGTYTIIGTASDAHILSYSIFCLNAQTKTMIHLSHDNVIDDEIGSFTTSEMDEGQYTLVVTVNDHAGNTNQFTMPITLYASGNSLLLSELNNTNEMFHLLDISQYPLINTVHYESADSPNIWINDEVPPGALILDTWNWDHHIKYTGETAHTDPLKSGTHGHYFIRAEQTLSLDASDNIIQYVYLDPETIPDEILLQFYTNNGDGEHRVFWGKNRIKTDGVIGTESLMHMGNLPEAGQWIRLKIPSDLLGLNGQEIKGIVFAVYNGKAYWDKTTKSAYRDENQQTNWHKITETDFNHSTLSVFNVLITQPTNLIFTILDDTDSLIWTVTKQFNTKGIYELMWNAINLSNQLVPDGQYTYRFTNSNHQINQTGSIDVLTIFADIVTPYDDMMVYGKVPILGIACAKNFTRYDIAYANLSHETEWQTILSSNTQVLGKNHVNPDMKSKWGVLGTWHVDDDLKKGSYNIRLRVYNKNNQFKEDIITVYVGSHLNVNKTPITSDDSLAYFVNNEAANDDLNLFSLTHVDSDEFKGNSDTLERISNVYKLMYSGYDLSSSLQLCIRYTYSQAIGIDENRLKICQWNKQKQSWITLSSTLNTNDKLLCTTISTLSHTQDYFAMMYCKKNTPLLFQLQSPARLKIIDIYGQSYPGDDIALFVNNKLIGHTIANQENGVFVKNRVLLNLGDNEITARIISNSTESWPMSKPLMVQLEQSGDISTINQISIKSSDYSNNYMEHTGSGESLFIEAPGTDLNPDILDVVDIQLKSSQTDPIGITIQLLETSSTSGIYRGSVMLDELSSEVNRTIGVSSTLTEVIHVLFDNYTGPDVLIQSQDINPPDPPCIHSLTHYQSCKGEGYENLACGSSTDPIFVISSNESDHFGVSFDFDQTPDTIPDNTIDGHSYTISYVDISDGIWFFHARFVDEMGNWSDASHYSIMVDTNGPVAISIEPYNTLSYNGRIIHMQLSDMGGSGVNPNTIVVQHNNMNYGIDSTSLKYDAKKHMVMVYVYSLFSDPNAWLVNESSTITLVFAEDYSGNSLQEQCVTTWPVDNTHITNRHIIQLTKFGGSHPTWSKDSNQIAFVSERSGNRDIWIINADDYAERNASTDQLTFDYADDYDPAFSPFENRIAFVSDRSGDAQIYIIQPDQPDVIQVTNHHSLVTANPSWLSQSTLIFSKDNEIWRINTDGTCLTRLLASYINERYSEPTFSIDSNHIIFTSYLSASTISIINGDGSNRQDIIKNGKNPVWGNYSNTVLFTAIDDKTPDSIKLFDFNTHDAYSIIDNQNIWQDSNPVQSMNTNDIAFQSTRDGKTNLWLLTEVVIDHINVTPESFSPNADGIIDTTDIQFSLSGGIPAVQVTIFNASGYSVTTLLDENDVIDMSNQITWNGTDQMGTIVPDGIYTCKVISRGNFKMSAIEKSITITVDTTPPHFEDWLIPVEFSDNATYFTMTVLSGMDLNSKWLQYGIASSNSDDSPNVIGWDDFGEGLDGQLHLNWSNYEGMYLFIRAYAEDMLGNFSYSTIEKLLISNSQQFVRVRKSNIIVRDRNNGQSHQDEILRQLTNVIETLQIISGVHTNLDKIPSRIDMIKKPGLKDALFLLRTISGINHYSKETD